MKNATPDTSLHPPSEPQAGGGFLFRAVRASGGGLAVLVVAIALLDLILRAMGLASPVLYVDDEATGYRLRPDQQARYLMNTISVNRWGVRDARSFDSRERDVKRLVVLGDSVTWGGIRIRQEDLFTSVLERALRETEVVNAGINGYSVGQMARLYRHHLAALDADEIVVFVIPRDFVRPPRVTLIRDSASFPRRAPRFALPMALEGARMTLFQKTGLSFLEPVPVTRPDNADLTEEQRMSENVAELVRLQRDVAGKTRLWAVMSPVLPGSPGDGPRTEIETALRTAGVPYIDLGDVLPPQPAFYVDGVHFSEEGHRRVGMALAAALNDAGSDRSPAE